MSNDIDLIKRLQNSKENVSAWAEVIDVYYSGLNLFCGRFVRDRGETQDLVHETFIKGMENIGKFDIQRFTSLRPWLWQIARNVGLDYIRSRKNKEDKWEPLSISQSSTTHAFFKIMDKKPGPRTEASVRDKYEILFESLDQLDEKFSEVVLLHYMDGLTRKDIAEYLEIPENTVKSRLKIALKKLRLLLPIDLYEKK